MNKNDVLNAPDFELLNDYLESMFPDRYEFQEYELIIYYPKVTIKNSTLQTYDIHNVFIHYGYNDNDFKFTKLHYTLNDYMNQTGSLFTHPHIARSKTAFKLQSYCKGKLNTEHDFNNLTYVIQAINSTDFWLHNENSSDCYTHIANLFYNNGNDSLTNITFNYDVKNELIEDMISNISMKKTIFGDIIDIEWNDNAIINTLDECALNKRIYCVNDLTNLMSKYNELQLTFKGKQYYITIDSFNAKTIIDNTKSNINENVLQQFKQISTGVSKNTNFLSKLERYYFNNLY